MGLTCRSPFSELSRKCGSLHANRFLRAAGEHVSRIGVDFVDFEPKAQNKRLLPPTAPERGAGSDLKT